jgi:dihydroflavonol-4-reductase
MTRTALVTGATGFIGRWLVAALLREGWRVRALVEPREHGRLSAGDRLELVTGDITDPASLRGTASGADVVFHLAALVAPWIPRPREFARVNVTGTDHVIEEALRAGARRFLFTSSLSSIGVRPGEVLREDSPPGKVFGDYEASKAEAEARVLAAYRDRGLPAVVLIPSIVIGPGDVRNTGAFLLAFARGELPGTFAEGSVLPVVGVDDVVRAHVLAVERGSIGSRYIISAENRTWGDLLRLASVASGTPMPARRIGPFTLRLAARTGEFASRLTRRAPSIPFWLADFLLTGAAMDNAKSIRELGMTYRPIEESIRAAVEWFRAEGLLAPARSSKTPSLPTALGIENPLDRPAVPARDMPAARRPRPPDGRS